MKNKNITIGLLLIFLGFIWILSNLNLIDINLYNVFILLISGLFDLWPLILVIIGVGIIVKNDLLNTILWVLFFVFVIIYSLFIKGNILEDNTEKLYKEEVYTSEMRKNIEVGHLNLDVGATNFRIDSEDDKFVKIEQDGAFKYKVTSKGSIENLYISNKSNSFYKGDTRNLGISLNKGIPWSFDINVGAVSGQLNLQDMMIKTIVLDMGAGEIEMNLGKNNELTFLDIDAGASQIKINIPKDSGLKVELDGGLNTSNLDQLGLIKLDNGDYISQNYDLSLVKFEIDVDMGVGSFEINYY